MKTLLLITLLTTSLSYTYGNSFGVDPLSTRSDAQKRGIETMVTRPIGDLFHAKSQKIVIYDKHGKIIFKKKLKKSDIKKNNLPIKARYLTTKKRIRYYMAL